MSEVLPTVVIPTGELGNASNGGGCGVVEMATPCTEGFPSRVRCGAIPYGGGNPCENLVGECPLHCGSALRGERKGKFCPNAPCRGGTRCRMHSGKAAGGVAHPSYRHGRYSKCLPKNLKKHYETAIDDPELLNLSEDLSLLTARVSELLERMGDNPPPPWTQAQTLFAKLVGGLEKDDYEGPLNDLGKILDNGADRAKVQERCWREVRALVQEKTKTSQAEWKRLNEMKGVVAVGEVLAFAQAFLEAAKEVIKDRNTLRELHRRTLVLLPRDEKSRDGGGVDNGEEGG